MGERDNALVEISVEGELIKLWDTAFGDKEYRMAHVRLDRYAFNLFLKEVYWNRDWDPQKQNGNSPGRWRNLPVIVTAPKLPSRVPKNFSEHQVLHRPQEICIALKQSGDFGRWKYLDAAALRQGAHND